MDSICDQQFRTYDSLAKMTITSLDQLSKLYGTKSARQIAQSFVYGQKPKHTTGSQNYKRQSSRAQTQEDQNTNPRCKSPPSKMTLLSQQLYHQSVENKPTARAFATKEAQLLLSSNRLNSVPTSEGPMTDVTNRLIGFQGYLDNKKEQIKERVVQEQMQECTFQPQIDGKSRTLALKATQMDVRSVEQFHEDQMKYIQLCQERKELLLERRAQEEQSLMKEGPLLSTKSEKLAKQRFGNQSVLERLYSPSKSKTQTSVAPESPQYSFHPSISNKAKTIKRDQPIDEYLFQDAQQRKLKQQESTSQQLNSSSVIVSESSIAWFVQRFIKEFYFQLSCLDRIKIAEHKDYSRLTYSETLQVLQGLNYLRQNQNFQQDQEARMYLALLWSHLTPSENPNSSILSRNLLVMLLAILAVPIQHTQIPCYKPHSCQEDEGLYIGESDVLFQQSRAEFLQPDDAQSTQSHQKMIRPKRQLKMDEHSNIQITEQDLQYLHQTFYKLYLNTKQLSRGNGKRRQMARSPQSNQRLHSPQISSSSHILSINKRQQLMGDFGEFNMFEWFQMQEQLKKARLDDLKEQIQNSEMRECTFGSQFQRHCTINLNELARPLPKNNDRRPQDVEFEKQASECTFQPTPKSKGTPIVIQPFQTHVNKAVDRIKEARVRQKALEQLKEKGMTTNNSIRGQVKRKAQDQENISKGQKLRTAKSQPMSKKLKTESSMLENSNKKKTEETSEYQLFAEEKVPLLFVDVNIEEGKTARIVVYEGDRSDELADRFSMEHNLDEQMKVKLKELLDVQINSLLTKIDENVYEDSDQEQEH